MSYDISPSVSDLLHPEERYFLIVSYRAKQLLHFFW